MTHQRYTNDETWLKHKFSKLMMMTENFSSACWPKRESQHTSLRNAFHFHSFVLNQLKSSLCVSGPLKGISSFSCFVISTGIVKTYAILTATMFHCVLPSAVSALYSRWTYLQNLQISTVPINAQIYYYVFHF